MNTQDDRSKHNDDLNGIKGISVNLKEMPFIVPENYFDSLSSKIQQRIEIIESSESSFAVPEGYFDTLSERIRKKITQGEHENTNAQNEYPLVNEYDSNEEISFINELKATVSTAGFETPVNYFENLTGNIEESIKKHSSAEIVTLRDSHKRKKIRPLTWIGYAAAACIAISVSAYAFFQVNSVDSFQNRLDNISENEIVSYLEYYTEPGDVTMLETQFEGAAQTNEADFSKEDIEAYLDYSI